MPFAVSFIGYHDTGKTTLLAEVARVLLKRGLRVGALKSSKEDRPRLEAAAADTNLIWATGVGKVAFWGRKEGFLRYFVPEKDEFSFWYFVNRFFPEEEIVLCEGFKGLKSLPKIEILREDSPEPPLYERGLPGLIAVVSKTPVEVNLPVLPPEPEKIANFIQGLLPRRRPEVNLLVNGRPVGLTRFVAKALSASVRGFIKTLRGVSEPHLIELRIETFEDEG